MKRVAEDYTNDEDDTATTASVSIDSDLERSDEEESEESEESEEEEVTELISIQREKLLQEKLLKEHDIKIDLLSEEDLLETDPFACDQVIGDPNGLHYGKITQENVVEVVHLSHNEIDLQAIAEKGSLFGLRYTDLELTSKSAKIRYPRCSVTHCILKSGVIIVSSRGGGSTSVTAREKLLSHTLALLRYICGLTDLVIDTKICASIVAQTTLNYVPPSSGVRDMCTTLGIPYDEVRMAIHYKTLTTNAESLVREEPANIVFIFSPLRGHIICVGGQSVASVIDAFRVLLSHLAPYAPKITTGNKKRRVV